MNLNTVKIKPELLNIALLILRLVMGTMMIANHGWTKVVKYEVLKTEFFSFLGLGSQFSLILAILAEILCSILVIFGLFTRAALVPLIITMLVAVSINNWELFGKAEMGFLYLTGFLFLLLVGPGEKSIDYKMSRKSYF
ncbi:MAG TPA: DoxX family protein [Flavobacterium sp.]|nr:DoxX family protein [Flavobacterium sp.]